MTSQSPSYRGYRFPPEIISHAVWLYHRFSLSFRDVEDLLAQRGVTVSYEAIRQRCQTFGLDYARKLRRRRGQMGDTWYLDELFVTIRGRRHYLWRAVDQDGDVLHSRPVRTTDGVLRIPTCAEIADFAALPSPCAALALQQLLRFEGPGRVIDLDLV